MQFLKYVPAVSIIGQRVQKPGVHDLQWAPCFNVADSWNGPVFWDAHTRICHSVHGVKESLSREGVSVREVSLIETLTG